MTSSKTIIQADELIYEGVVRVTSVTAFGASLDALAAGAAAPPPEGARFDIAFEGDVSGPKIAGRVSGVDYANVRADGHFELDIRGHLAASDGHSIAIAAGGIARPGAQAGIYEVREHMCYRTAAPPYAWLNKVEGWIVGTLDLAAGELRLKAYSA